MSLLFESFLRTTNSDNIQEWFDDLKNLLEQLEEMPDPDAEDVQLAFHLNNMVENFEMMKSNLLDRRKKKNRQVDKIFERKSTGSSVLFD